MILGVGARGVVFYRSLYRAGGGVRVVLEETEGCERGEDMCTHCAEKWHKSDIKSSFEGVVWTSKKTARATDQRTQYEEAFVEAFYTAANYGFMDGVMKLLAVRLLDVVIHGRLCDVHRKLMVQVFFVFSAPLA